MSENIMSSKGVEDFLSDKVVKRKTSHVLEKFPTTSTMLHKAYTLHSKTCKLVNIIFGFNPHSAAPTYDSPPEEEYIAVPKVRLIRSGNSGDRRAMGRQLAYLELPPKLQSISSLGPSAGPEGCAL